MESRRASCRFSPVFLGAEGTAPLYGGGPSYSYGTLFEVKVGTSAVTDLHNFYYYSNGGIYPAGLVGDSTGNLFGVTTSIGYYYYHSASVFKYNISGSSFSFLYYGTNFSGQLAVDGSDNVYGTQSSGGVNGIGTVFDLTNGGSSYTFNTLASFISTTGINGLVVDSTGNAFGTTSQGGLYGYGQIFEVANGSNTISTLYSFTGGAGGANPANSLILDAADDLYGTTNSGGANNLGTVFELVKTAGSYAAAPTTLASFSYSTGFHPLGGLVEDSATGNLFGTAQNGGAGGAGTVFEVVAGSGIATVLASFNSTNGQTPQGGLVRDSAGDLFGTTVYGGVYDNGTVFEVANGSNAITTLYSFIGGTDGNYPFGGLIADASGNLFGTTQYGGSNLNDGTVFELTAGSFTFSTLAAFNAVNGQRPAGILVADANGNLFGTTLYGGANNQGTVFELTAGTITALDSFNGTNGATPQGVLAKDANGNLFGITTGGGASGVGTVFEVYGAKTLAYSSGNGQSATVGTTLAAPLVVQVTDTQGNPLAGVLVTWTASIGGSVSSMYSVTNASGQASINAKLGTTAGSETFTAAVAGLSGSPVTFTETANADTTSETLSYVGGNNQTGAPAVALASPLVVQVTDQYGNPITGAAISWAVTAGGGSFRSTQTTTGANGQAIATAVLGGDFTSTYTATATGLTGPPVITFNETLSSLIVTTTQDENNPNDGTLSLREAIAAANTLGGTNTITFAPNVTGQITLTSALPQISSNVTIQGPGANVLAVNGEGHSSVFSISSGTVAINGLTITGGIGNGNGSEGGGVFISSGNVSLANDAITNNSAVFGGGVMNFGTATLTDDTIANNKASSYGAGIYNGGGSMTVVSSTITGNNGPSAGGGILNYQATLTLLNDSITANTASNQGGGIQNGLSSSSGTVQDIFDTIIDGNSAPTGPDVFNSSGNVFTSQGGNLYGNKTGNETVNVTWNTTGSFKDVPDTNDNPGLGALQYNGGLTPTLAELPGSPALQVGLLTGSGGATPPTADQRGFSRIVNGNIDIGAYENQGQLFTLTAPASEPTVDAGQSANYNLGSFTYSGSANPFFVDVNWGDGSPNTVFSTNSQGTLPQQSHTYATNTGSPFTITVSVSDANNNFGKTTAAATVNPVLITSLIVNTNGDTNAVNANTSPNDSSGHISLRSAIQYADANNLTATVGFASNVTGQITLTSALPQISSNVTIQGPGANVLTVSGNNAYQIFNIAGGNVAIDTISGLTISGGSAPSGGGIYARGHFQVSLTDDTIANNQAKYFGGGVAGLGANLTITNSILTGNTGFGGGGGVEDQGGNVTISNSTFSSNIAPAAIGGGVLSNSFGNLTISNSTFTGNVAANGGGVYNSFGNLTISSSTFTGNVASNGGGIYAGSNGILYLYDSIVDGNSGYDVYNQGTFTSSGGNLYGTSSRVTWMTTGAYPDIQSSNPLLGLLQNNGGPTPTIALLPGSPALDAGNTASAPATDQRGFQRNLSRPIDIGAFENQSQLFTLTAPASEPTVDAGQSAAFNLGSFTYSGSAPSIWKVDVNWGDGSPDTVFTTLNQGSLGTQNHAYAASGSYNISITVTDVDGNFIRTPQPSTNTVTVDSAITISSPASVPAGMVGGTYTSTTFTASGGSGTYTSYTTTGNTDGLTLTGNTLGGIPTNPGTFAFTITATDSNGATGSQNYSLFVYPALTITTNTLPIGTVGNG